jgi:hypothetical protein
MFEIIGTCKSLFICRTVLTQIEIANGKASKIALGAPTEVV